MFTMRRSRSLQHTQALNSRCRELQGQLKQCKQELRRSRKTVKTLELVATAVSNGAAAAAAPAAAAAGSAVNVAMQAAAHQQQQQGVPVVLPGSQHVVTVQQQGGSLMYMTAGVSRYRDPCLHITSAATCTCVATLCAKCCAVMALPERMQ
jgi:hypothetical protein